MNRFVVSVAEAGGTALAAARKVCSFTSDYPHIREHEKNIILPSPIRFVHDGHHI